MAHGHVDHLSPGEIKLSSEHSVRPPSTNRAWDYWVRHVQEAGLMPAKPGAKRARAKAAPPRPKARKRR